MKTKTKVFLVLTASLFLLFALFTVLLLTVDVAPIGPSDSEVGLAGLNHAAREAFGSSSLAYGISEILGLLCLGGAAALALVALAQWIRRRSLRRVNTDLILLGGAYALTAAFYALFEVVVINYRPVPEEGQLAPSYPSSHTVLALVITATAAVFLWRNLSSRPWRAVSLCGCALVGAATAVCRALSGVHWLTDILGACLLSAAIVLLYVLALQLADRRVGVKKE